MGPLRQFQIFNAIPMKFGSFEKNMSINQISRSFFKCNTALSQKLQFVTLMKMKIHQSLYFHLLIKVGKSQKHNCRPKLIPKMNGRICFSILTVRNYLKLEIETSSFMYFRTLRIEKQIRPFVFGKSLCLRFTDL